MTLSDPESAPLAPDAPHLVVAPPGPRSRVARRLRAVESPNVTGIGPDFRSCGTRRAVRRCATSTATPIWTRRRRLASR
jgi:hypothetical protein